MNKITAFLGNGSHNLYLNGFIKANADSKMIVKNGTIYWNFNNISTDVNDTIISTNRAGGTPTTITFEEGYWTFNMIATKLHENGVTLERNAHNNTCKFHTKHSQIDLKGFAPLLGFPANTTIPFSNTPTTSPSTVDINKGLKFVTIGCGAVNTNKNFDTNGRKSSVITTIPLTSEQALNSTVTFFKDINSEVPIVNGFHNMLRFDIGTNIGDDVQLTALIECYIK